MYVSSPFAEKPENVDGVRVSYGKRHEIRDRGLKSAKSADRSQSRAMFALL